MITGVQRIHGVELIINYANSHRTVYLAIIETNECCIEKKGSCTRYGNYNLRFPREMSDPLIRDTQGKLYEAKGQKWKKYITLVSAEARSHTSPFWLVSMASMHRLNESKEEWSGVQCRRA